MGGGRTRQICWVVSTFICHEEGAAPGSHTCQTVGEPVSQAPGGLPRAITFQKDK